MRRPKAILFDHDGVLVQSEPLHWAAWEKLLAELGLGYSIDVVRRSVGKTGPQILAAILDAEKPGWSRDEYDLDRLAFRKNEIYLASAQTGLKPYPGVVDGLHWLRAHGIKRAVVSNAKRRELEGALRGLQMTDLFDVVISRDEIQPPKPHPAPYLFGAASVGEEPADCVAIEDSPPGLEAALTGRIPTAAVTTNFPREQLERPVPGRPDLRPVWIGEGMIAFFDWIRSLPTD